MSKAKIEAMPSLQPTLPAPATSYRLGPSPTTTSLPPPPNHQNRQLPLRQQDQLGFLIDKCKSVSNLLQIHAAILRRGYETDPILSFKLQKTYASLGRLDFSSSLFERTDEPNVFFYSAIIHSHVQQGLHRDALSLYAQMLNDGIEPNAFTFSSVLKSCKVGPGTIIHSQSIKLGLDGNLYVRTGLVDVYARAGDVVSAQKLFDTMPEKSLVSLTTMLTCYAKHGDLVKARRLFDSMHEKDEVCWNVMIDGYSQHGQPQEALALFRLMLKDKRGANDVTFLSVLSACGQLGALELGKWVHSYLVNNRISINLHLATALVDMYSKCGSLNDARVVFDGISYKDVVAWNSMIVGYAMHGFSQEALNLFSKMREAGFRPTDITMIGVLNACAHAGLVREGKAYFDSMKNMFSIEPKVEHFGCMVNLLGRAGYLQEAYELVRNMGGIDPDAVVWGTLLGACRLHGNSALGVEIADFLVSNNLAHSGTYVLLSHIYASKGNWDGVARVRAMMTERGIQKEPGCSSIEVENTVHEFIAGDLRHPKCKEIYTMLEEISGWLKGSGYEPQTKVVLQDIGEVEKEQSLGVHSEKLAIAFGLISTKPGTMIKIVKNLRVCSDCHEVTKLISKITGRRIVVRDRNRFHHFVDGSCSCGDYW